MTRYLAIAWCSILMFWKTLPTWLLCSVWGEKDDTPWPSPARRKVLTEYMKKHFHHNSTVERVIQRNCGILTSKGFQVPAQSILSCTLLCPSSLFPNLLPHLIPLVSYVRHAIMVHGPPSGFDATRSTVRIRVTLLNLACKITTTFTRSEKQWHQIKAHKPEVKHGTLSAG